jgi:hypothetical protein
MIRFLKEAQLGRTGRTLNHPTPLFPDHTFDIFENLSQLPVQFRKAFINLFERSSEFAWVFFFPRLLAQMP